MKISSKGRYGIRLLIDLAENAKNMEEGHISLASAAERRKISIRYLEQVAVILRRAGFIRSVKGASGGYALSRPPEKINIGDVLRVLEGDMLVADSPLPGVLETKFRRCVRNAVLERLNESIAAIIDSHTLASLVDKSENNETLMYFI
jgi:Rrf2 family protein